MAGTETPIDFEYDLEEIVNMDGVGPVSLASALKRLPDRIGVLSMLHRDVGKNPSFFNAAQIEALLARYRSDFSAATRPATAKPTRTIFRAHR